MDWTVRGRSFGKDGAILDKLPNRVVDSKRSRKPLIAVLIVHQVSDRTVREHSREMIKLPNWVVQLISVDSRSHHHQCLQQLLSAQLGIDHSQ